MGLLDTWNVGPDLPALSGGRARRVLREGEACDAEVVGIEVEAARAATPSSPSTGTRSTSDRRPASRAWASASGSRRATTPASGP
jgi:hypothetical protein